MVLADSKTLVTASLDCTVSVWTLTCTSRAADLQPKKTLFGHGSAVKTLAVSRSFSALLSASDDGQVILWDLNKLELVRELSNGKPVDVSTQSQSSLRPWLMIQQCAQINDVTGNILLCCDSEVSVWTLNGELLIQEDVHVEGDDTISSCAFFEGDGIDYLERQLVFTGHQHGVVNVSLGSFIVGWERLTAQ